MAEAVTVEGQELGSDKVAEETEPESVRNAIARETQSWGSALLFFGIMQFVRSDVLDPMWGVVLILTGGATFFFRSAAMLPVYGVLLIWAMITNLLSGSALFMVVGAVQGILACRTFWQFARLRRSVIRLGIGFGADGRDRAAAVFAWAGCGLSAAAFVASILLITAVGVSLAQNQPEPSDKAYEMAANALLDLVCLGLAASVAALLARYRFRAISILALVGSGLMLAGLVLVAIIGAGA